MVNGTRNSIRHNMDLGRFELLMEGNMAVLDYRMDDSVIIFTHTGVPAELEGRGIGSQLVRAGLDFARVNMLRVVPACWFVAGYIERHPEYQDVLV